VRFFTISEEAEVLENGKGIMSRRAKILD